MHYINLASGSSYFSSPEAAITAATQALSVNSNSYGTIEGTPGLRTAIADRYSAEGMPLHPDQVLITPGSKYALFCIMSVLLHEGGDEVVIPTPAWFGFNDLVKYSGGKLVTVPTTLADGYTLTPEALRRVLTPKSRVLLLTNPGNPTGRVYSKTELEAILDLLDEYPNLYLISDEIYDFVTYNGPVASVFSCKRTQERTLVVNGFSKSFAMSGWRIGFLAGLADIIQQCAAFQMGTLSGVPQFIQAAAQATMEQRNDALQPMLHQLGINRLIMQQELDKLQHVRYYLPDGAYYFFPDFSSYLPATTPNQVHLETSTDLCTYLKEEHALELSPGDYFGSPGHARMSFAVEEPELREAMHRLSTALKSLTLD